jgi:putative ABC transport system permease protein
MFRNYLKVALRNLLKRKSYTLINVFGLATGMAVCLLIVLFINSELGYDSFHLKSERIYRVVLERKYPERSTHYSFIPGAIGEAIKTEFPEVEESTRVFNFLGNGNYFIRIGEKVFEEQRVLLADSNFFRVFNAAFIAGDPATALQHPNTVVVNESTAIRYFGSAQNALRKPLATDGNNNIEISGIIRDWPSNSHFHFDLLLASATFPVTRQPNYINFAAHTYLLLKPNADAEGLERKFPHIVDKYVSGEIGRNFGQTFEQFKAAGNGYNYFLQPLKKIHLNSDMEGELGANGSMRSVYIFSIIALFILIIACTNFVNLSTARSVERAKEVGVRKTFGSLRSSLVSQFLVESILISFISLLLAFGIIFLLLPLFNQLAGKSMSFAYLLDPSSLLLLIVFSVLVGFVAGLYPAFVLSSFRPGVVLKGKFKSNRYGILLRNGLVVFQFSISVILIICAIIVNQQISYMSGDRLGFNKEHLIVIERTDLLEQQNPAFKNEVKQVPGVMQVSGTTALPGQPNYFGISIQPVGSKEQMTGRGLIADPEFAAALQLELVEGRFFSKQFSTDSLSIVLNEKAVKELGLKEPLGARLTIMDENFNAPDGTPYQYTVVGILKDFHFQSLHQAIVPLVVTNAVKFGENMPITTVRVNAGNFNKVIAGIENVWKKFVPARPFHFSFLEQDLQQQYLAERTSQQIFTIFSILAVVIACIGLLGLAAYTTQQRLREISIRKVLGASVLNIVRILSVDFLKLVGLAALIAFPLAWWAMHNWLDDFAYRIPIRWEVFVLAGGVAFLVAIFTISFQAIRASIKNPVTNLRSE